MLFRNDRNVEFDRHNEMTANFIGDNNYIDNDMTIDVNMNAMPQAQGGCPCNMPQPIMEPMQERCVHKTIMHEVPQV